MIKSRRISVGRWAVEGSGQAANGAVSEGARPARTGRHAQCSHSWWNSLKNNSGSGEKRQRDYADRAVSIVIVDHWLAQRKSV